MNLDDELRKAREELMKALNVANYPEASGEDAIDGNQNAKALGEEEAISISKVVADAVEEIHRACRIEANEVDVARDCLAQLEGYAAELMMSIEIASRMHRDKDVSIMLKAKQWMETNVDEVFEYIKMVLKGEKGSQSSSITWEMNKAISYSIMNEVSSGLGNISNLISKYLETPQSVL